MNSIIIVLALILLASAVVTACTYAYVESIIKKREKTNREKVTPVLPTQIIPTQEVHSDGVLAASSAILGLISLELFARGRNPDYIIGVNRGGWLLSTYLAHRLDVGRDNFLRFNAETQEFTEDITSLLTSCKNQPKNFLIVDDISRKGDSIQIAIDYVKSKFPSVNFSVAVLVVCGRDIDEKIQYNPYWTKRNDIQLPWSSEVRKMEARKNIKSNDVVYLNEGSLESLDKKDSVLRIADNQNVEGVDISSNDIEAILNLVQTFERRLAQV